MPQSQQSDPLPTKEHRRLHAACALKHAKLALREIIKAIFPNFKIPLPEKPKS